MQTKQKGFSLIEVLISFVLIGVGSLGLLKLQAYIEQKADHAKHSIEALNAAEHVLECFRTRGIAAPVANCASYFDPPPNNLFKRIPAGKGPIVSALNPNYSVSWNVSEPIPELLKEITVRGIWNDRHGNPQSVELKTMISKHSEFD